VQGNTNSNVHDTSMSLLNKTIISHMLVIAFTFELKAPQGKSKKLRMISLRAYWLPGPRIHSSLLKGV